MIIIGEKYSVHDGGASNIRNPIPKPTIPGTYPDPSPNRDPDCDRDTNLKPNPNPPTCHPNPNPNPNLIWHLLPHGF